MHNALRNLTADYALKEVRLRKRPGVWQLTSEYAEGCACKGLLHVLQWACEKHGCSCDTYACSSAAQEGQLEVLKWLRKKGCHWDAETFHNAAKRGDLKMMQWLRRKGCPWNESTCSYAALYHHFKELQWLRKEGCPWDSGIL